MSQVLTLVLFGVVTAFTPGPNNISAAYSGFHFGFKKTIPLSFCKLLCKVNQAAFQET